MCVKQSKTHIIIIIRYVYTQLYDDDETCVRIKYMMECDVVRYFPFAAAAVETNLRRVHYDIHQSRAAAR